MAKGKQAAATAVRDDVRIMLILFSQTNWNLQNLFYRF